MPTSIAAELKATTAKAHEDAEHSGFMTALLEGRLDAGAATRLHAQLWWVYSALEEATRRVRDVHPELTGLLDARLERAQHLEADLQATLCEHGRPSDTEMLPATQRYVHRLRAIGQHADAARLVAHHYIRYLGDLSGGQIIARMLERQYGMDPQHLRFYHFERLGKLKAYRDRYKAALDALEFSPAQRAALMHEAGEAFAYNRALFSDLGDLEHQMAEASPRSLASSHPLRL